MKVVVAPDGFGGTLSAAEVAAAVAEGWRQVRADDEVVELPLSDGGEGLLGVVAGPGDRHLEVEVAGPRGHPVTARLLHRGEGTVVLESALACGLTLLEPDDRDPLVTTTYGVGQLLLAARDAGASRVLVGLGGSATVDGGAGALTALGYRLLVADGSGLKIGGGQLHRIDRIEPGWVPDFSDVEVVLLADVDTPLGQAAARFGPQKGADASAVRWLASGLERFAEVVERDLTDGTRLREQPGTGAAGGLGYALAAALGARFHPGAAAVGALVGLPAAVAGADLVVTGEGRLDATTTEGKVVAHVVDLARRAGTPVAAVVGALATPQVAVELGLRQLVQASPAGPGPDPWADAVQAGRRLAEQQL